MTIKPGKPAARKRLACGRPLPPTVESAQDSRALLSQLSARLDAHCQAKSLNRTEAREKILETIVFEARHFTARDLLKRLQKRFPEVGRATLYRNLPVLVESRVIQEGPQDPDGHTNYELTEEHHHDHIVCVDCRQIFEFHDDLIEKRQNRLTSDMGFAAREHRHVIFASCEYLKKDERAKRG